MRAKRLLCWIFLVLSLSLLGLAASENSVPDRIVAVGDIHGDFDDFCSLLKRAGLLNDQNHWIGGSTVLVQTGDVIDRGPRGRETMDLLMRLETESSAAGGKVVPLLGNHEVMNIIGDLRYVSAQEYGAFTDSDSQKRRLAAYQDYNTWYAKHQKLLAALKQPLALETEEEWMAEHPLGFLEYREALGAKGVYGKWIRTHNAVTRLGPVLFLHGGISPDVASMSVDQINRQVHKELEDFDQTMQNLVARKVILPFFTLRELTAAVQAELLAERDGAPVSTEDQNSLVRTLSFNSWLSMKDDGPLWFRSYDKWSDEEGMPQIDKILAAYKAKHLVVSHTVQKSAHIRSRFQGKVFLIDTGMLSTYWPGGKASALEIRDEKFTALYIDGQEVLLDEKSTASQGEKN